MKSISALAAIIPLLPVAEALVGLDWSATNIPSTGLRDITFPISIANAPREEGFYFAQQFSFNGVSDVGYTGLQPRPDANGASIIHAVFSSFVPGSTSTDENCSDGADGGAGVSCAVEIPASYAPMYHLVIKNTEGTTWTGTLVDTVNNNETHIGEYTLPSGTGGIKESQVGFVEYYPWNAVPEHTCDSLPYTNATFLNPTSSESGVTATVGRPYEYGDCENHAGFDVQEVEDGFEVSVGF
ncbi:hypothetical protein BDV36DRAFT_288008 [Aspergillus pseudocaelatus]|uniref:Ubiquitin 3 binding protein But2 C-terminal domain-containing protein n=1 Tax=Aspergillus pseudocaelatus TaxID=1825620 RepID=A0ABQ6W559_9EURO|nr:hypothetical protein BDV36DRAFT_288008 [Aspergillus pseudocaelatus]